MKGDKKMNQLTKFFEGKEVRLIGDYSKPLFVLRDVCNVLEIQHTQPIVQRYEEDGVFSKYVIEDRFGRSQEMTMVNEEGLYEILFDSRKKEAKVFRKWVTKEVIPSIRKDGGYIIAQPDESPEVIMARGLIAAQATIERMKQEQSQALETIEEQKPLVAFAEIVERSSDSILVREFAKVVSKRGFIIGEKKLFKRLRHCKYLDKKNMPYQRYIDQGIFEVMERPIPNPNVTTLKFTTRITGKGQIYLYNKLLTGELHDEL